uniref:Uncharacterized protein n=1 Tax=Caenorhabditis japonica TaxID=281687 RepID=A0A8R1E551_CAEJA
MACSSRIVAVLLLLAVGTIAVDPLDFLFSSNMAQYPRYRPISSSNAAAVDANFGKRFWIGAPPGCVCTEFLGCHGPGCMRRMYQKAT